MGKDDEKGGKLFVFHRKVFLQNGFLAKDEKLTFKPFVTGALSSPMQISRFLKILCLNL